MRKFFASLFVGVFLLLISCSASAAQGVSKAEGAPLSYTQISQEEAKEMTSWDDGHIVVDVLGIGSPVYFSYPMGDVRSFMERLMFPILTYNPKVDEETGETKSSLLGRVVPTAMIYTMGVPSEQWAAECHYPEIFGGNERFLKDLFGYSETLCSYSSYQFSDYSRYDVMEGTQERRAKYRDEQLPIDLQDAYDLGRRLVEKVKEVQHEA